MIYDNLLNIYTTTPINQIPENERGVRYIELTHEQVERYNNWISNIGGSIPNNWVLTGEGIDYNSILTEKQLRDAKNSKLTELQDNYQSKLDEGYTYNSFTFNLDENTKGNIGDWISLNTISGGTITDYYITDSSNNQRQFTAQQFAEFGVGFGTVYATLKSAFSNKRNAINNSTTIEELNSINIADFNVEE